MAIRRVHISPAARALGIESPSAGVIYNVSASSEYPIEFSRRLDEILSSVAPHSDHAVGYRNIFKNMRYDAVVPAGERLLASFLANGFKRINTLVDAYNAISLKYAAGIGFHDADSMDADIVVDRAQGGEEITPLFQNKPRKIPAGDLVYSCGRRPIAWLGKRDVDSEEFKITDRTKAVLIVVLGNALTPTTMTTAMVREIFQLVAIACPNARLELQEIHFS